MSKLLDTALEAIRTRRADVERRYGIRLVGVVGSVARGDERADSDIDVVYDITGRPTLFDLSDVSFELEEAVGRAIDLVGREALKPDRRRYMERDLVVA